MLSQEQIKIQKKWKKANIKISSELRDIIHGYVMSDGYISENGSLQVDQSQKQAKFVQWLYEKLEPIRTDSPIQEVGRVDKRTQTKTFSKRFYTRSLLKGFRFMWYKKSSNTADSENFKKCLPKSINCFLNSTVLTLWFAGDGTKIPDQRGAKIEVTAFTREERLTLKRLFKQKFDLEVQVNRAGFTKKNTQQWVITIPADQYNKFRELITKMDLIPTLFPYKLHKV